MPDRTNQDEALVRVRGEGRGDFVHDLVKDQKQKPSLRGYSALPRTSRVPDAEFCEKAAGYTVLYCGSIRHVR